MLVEETRLPDVKIITPKVFGDDRGFFVESWNKKTFLDHGLDLSFVQDNHSLSSCGVLRGIHYQMNIPQGKLVRVAAGRVFDVAVDLRRLSPTFGEWVGVELSASNHKMLWVPPGHGHGFLSLEDETHFLYKCTTPYSPTDERCILWNDVDLAIDWPIQGINPLISMNDQQGAKLSQAECY